jgi:hypothetical protein
MTIEKSRREGDIMRCVLIGLNRAANLLLAVLLISLVGIGATPPAAATCASLAGLRLPDTTITLAEAISTGPYTARWQGLCQSACVLPDRSDFDADLGF